MPDLPFPPEHLEYRRGGMEAVANDVRGTAYRQSQLGLGDVKMAGKTGTAQVRSYDKVASRKSDQRRLDAEGPQPVRRLRALSTTRATPWR